MRFLCSTFICVSCIQMMAVDHRELGCQEESVRARPPEKQNLFGRAFAVAGYFREQVRRQIPVDVIRELGKGLAMTDALTLLDLLEPDPEFWQAMMATIIEVHRDTVTLEFRKRYDGYSATQKARLFYQLSRLEIPALIGYAQDELMSDEPVDIRNAPLSLKDGYTLGYFARLYLATIDETATQSGKRKGR